MCDKVQNWFGTRASSFTLLLHCVRVSSPLVRSMDSKPPRVTSIEATFYPISVRFVNKQPIKFIKYNHEFWP